MSLIFKNKVISFVNKLKTFDSSNFKRKIFNPWKQYDETDFSANSPEIRCNNLINYLVNLENADYILIAESPSAGARYSGIAMTSEKVIEKYKLNYCSYSSKNYLKNKKGEITASKVWNEISKSNKKFVLWNVFAFNIIKDETKNKWFEKPDDKEIEQNIALISEFLKLFPKSKIIALGKTAQLALNALKIENFECVRHPSNDFKKEFPQQIKKFL